MRWIAACVACLALALLWEGWSTRSAPELPLQAGARSSAPALDPSALEDEAARAPRASEATPAGPPLPIESPADEDLVELLRRVASAYAAEDVPALAASLERILIEPARGEETLELLAHGGLREEELARAGAVLALGAAVSRYAVADGRIAVDGHAFTVRVLEGLAEVLPPEQQDLAEQLIQAQAGERYVLDLSYLGAILELRRRHPELAEVYSSLLVHMAENLREGHELEEFRTLFLERGEDPTAVKLALSALLRTDAGTWLPLAESLFADSQDDARLQSAIAHAIATAAPVAQASEALARLARPELYLEFSLLGLRAGGREAIEERYSELVGSGSAAVARRMLISALRGEEEQLLVGIARTDPDPDVRTQALLTTSLGRASSAALLDELEAQHARRADPREGLPSSRVLLVAGNVLINSQGAERDRARDLLLRIAGDPDESDADRLAAVRTVRSWVPTGTFANWVIGGQRIE